MTDSNPRTDHRILTQHIYPTDEHLTVRYRTHELYSQPQIDFHEWVINTLSWRGDEIVLDVGAGSGGYFELVQSRIPNGVLIAGDLSFGMARQAQQNPHATRARLLTLDVQSLPFPDGTFDVVMANHMLYHASDIHLALGEIRRVLRRNGCLIAATNSQDTMPEFDTLARRACTLLGFPRQEIRPAHHPFNLENGPVMLARHFRAVARYDLPSAFHFPDTEPVMQYLNSLRPLNAPQLPNGVTWDSFMEVMEKQVSRLIRHFGELQVHKLTGALVATDGGGFAAEYLQVLNGNH
jgi:SAM-dependent methyltransferase